MRLLAEGHLTRQRLGGMLPLLTGKQLFYWRSLGCYLTGNKYMVGYIISKQLFWLIDVSEWKNDD